MKKASFVPESTAASGSALDYKKITDGAYSLYFATFNRLLVAEQQDQRALQVRDAEAEYQIRELFRYIMSDLNLKMGDEEDETIARAVMSEEMTYYDAWLKKNEVEEAYPTKENKKVTSASSGEGFAPVKVLRKPERSTDSPPDEWKDSMHLSKKYGSILKALHLRSVQADTNQYPIESIALTLFMRWRVLDHVVLEGSIPSNGSSGIIEVPAVLASPKKAGDFVLFGQNKVKVAKACAAGRSILAIHRPDVELDKGEVGFTCNPALIQNVQMGINDWTIQDSIQATWISSSIQNQVLQLFLEEKESGEKKLLPSSLELAEKEASVVELETEAVEVAV